MKRAKFLIGMVGYNIFITYLASATDLSYTGGGIPLAPEDRGIIGVMGDMINMFWDLLTLNVEGLPQFIVIIFFHLPNLLLFVVLIMILFNRR